MPPASVTLGIVCGLESEARALGDLRYDQRNMIGISGANPEQAEAQAVEMCNQRVAGLVSWGISAGLSPTMKTGDICIATRVSVETGEVVESKAPDAGRLLFGSNQIVFDASVKTALHGQTGAVALDMETHRVARVAAAHDIPWIAIRAISDSADIALPRIVADVVDASGRPRVWLVLSRMLRRPHELPALLRAKRDSDRAHEALGSSGRQRLGEFLQQMSKAP